MISPNSLSQTISCRGVNLQNSTSGYTPSNLNYYETGTINSSFSGALAVPVVLKYTRIGNMVVLFVNNIATQPATASGNLALTSVLPSRLLPQNEIREMFSSWRNGAFTGMSILQTNGQLTLFSDDTGAGWLLGEQCGYAGFSLVYVVN